MGAWRKFVALSWKNVMLRRGHCCLTSCDVILPLFMGILTYLLFTASLGKGGTAQSEQTFPSFNEKCLVNSVRVEEYGKTPIFAYAPNNTNVSEVIQNVELCLNNTLASEEKDSCDGEKAVYGRSTTEKEMVNVNDSDSTTKSVAVARFDEDDRHYRQGKIFPRFVGFISEEQIEVAALGEEKKMYDELDSGISYSSIKGAIIFEKSGIIKEGQIPYKIRLRKDPNHRGVDNLGFDSTSYLFRLNPTPGPEYSIIDEYRKSGFSGLQLCIDKALAKTILGKEFNRKVVVQPFPYPEYEGVKQTDGNGVINHFFYGLLPIFMVLAYANIPPSLVLLTVSEKETGMNEFLKMNGIPGWLQWLSWIVNQMVLLSIMNVLIVVCLVKDKRIGAGAFGNTNPILIYIVLEMFCMSSIAYAFFISVFFKRATLGSWVALTIGPIASLPIYFFFFYQGYDGSSLSSKMWGMVSPSIGLIFAIRTMIGHVLRGDGLGFSTVAKPLNSLNVLSLGHIMLMFVTTTILYLLLAVYIENVWPVSGYGVGKPFYYIFLPRTWFSEKEHGSDTLKSDQSEEDNPAFEAPPTDAKVMVDIRHLRKKFGWNKIAVADVTTKLYMGEIYALLGHNGAGKTTTISVISGILKPSGGSALVNGHDIRKDLEGVRLNLGLCPQENLYFKELTVLQHLTIFGFLKGLSATKSKQMAHTLMNRMNFSSKANELAPNLSGGQKRRLCLGIALMGKSKIVICDEPTSGMDPEARREIWDLLLDLRKDRCILLTTHHMEEADVLGDRVGIMYEGKLVCCGSPLFLKKYYGTGSTLRITLPHHKQSNGKEIISLVQSNIPDAHLKGDGTGVNQATSGATDDIVLSISLPTGTETSKLVQMFSALEGNKAILGIEGIGLSETTMDDVFLKAGAAVVEGEHNSNVEDVRGIKSAKKTESQGLKSSESLKKEKKADEVSEAKTTIIPVETFSQKNEEPNTRGDGTSASIGQQCLALLYKKYIYTYRNWSYALSQIVILWLTIAVAVYLSDWVAKSDTGYSGPLKISLTSYDSPVSLYHSSDQQFSNTLKGIIGKSAREGDANLTGSLLKVGRSDLHGYRTKYIIAENEDGINGTDHEMTALFNSIPIHASPLAINMASNAILKSLEPNQSYTISVTNHPLPTTTSETVGGYEPNRFYPIFIAVIYIIVFCVGFAMYTSIYIIQPLEERVNQSKQIQLMCGVSPVIYWNMTLLWDLLVHSIISAGACFGIIPLMESFPVLSSGNGLVIAWLVTVIYGYGAITFAYSVTFFADSVIVGFDLVLKLCFMGEISLLFGTVVLTIAFAFTIVLSLFALWVPDVMIFLGRLLPGFGGTMAWIRYAAISFHNGRCNVYNKALVNQICRKLESFKELYLGTKGVELIQCCGNCEQMKKRLGLPNYFHCQNDPLPYLSWSNKVHDYSGTIFLEVLQKGEDYQTVTGTAPELLIMFIVGLFYHLFTILYEYGIVQGWIENWQELGSFPATETVTDDDVMAEIGRVEVMERSSTQNEDALVVYDLGKRFITYGQGRQVCKRNGIFVAVSHLNFGVHHGECFGLLGVNGAGKSTTFKMLVGEIHASMGNAYAFDKSLEDDRKKFVENIGYCPQTNPIVDVFTGREMLTLLSKLRGVKDVKAEVNKWLEIMGLSESGNVACGKYSGGMKRRLSAALAMIGNPPLVFLDEPTSGVDPVSRRQFWKVLTSMRELGLSVVLTSHSMDECEYLCDRMGIMVNGQFQCFGGPQHLKNKFAQGYNLKIILKRGVMAASEIYKYKPKTPLVKGNQVKVGPENVPSDMTTAKQDANDVPLQQRCTALKDEISQEFEPCQLKDENLILLQYHLENNGLRWDFLYEKMESIKNKFEDIVEDFSINETTLEEVFLSFAKSQKPWKK